jgi:hypothetical protein
MFSDSIREQIDALEALKEILARRRRVPLGVLQNIYRVNRSARPLFASQLQPVFDRIWDVHERAWAVVVKQVKRDFPRIRDEIISKLGKGTPDGDMFALLYGMHFEDLLFFRPQKTDTEVRNEAVFAVAGRMPPKLKKPQAQRALLAKAQACSKPSHVLMRDEILPPALLLANDRGDVPQRIRLGKTYEKDDDGNVLEATPKDILEDVHYARWLQQEALKIAEHELLGRPYPPLRHDALEAKSLTQSEGPGLLRLEAVRRDIGRRLPFADPEIDRRKGVPLPIEPDHESIARVAALRKRLDAEASPKERDLLRVLDEEDDCSAAKLARRLGEAEGTVSVRLSRLRRKAKKISASL